MGGVSGTVLLLMMAYVTSAEWKFDPSKTRMFDPSASKSFAATTDSFHLKFADASELHGYKAFEEVELGEFRARVPVGILTDCNSPDFNGVDGIVGFGFPSPHPNYPPPLFWSLTNPSDKSSNALNIQRKFSFFSRDDRAELQLGGYDPDSVVGDMYFTRTVLRDHFQVAVTSVTYGPDKHSAVELMDFLEQRREGDTPEYIPATLDSGTTCFVMPDHDVGGMLGSSPYKRYLAHKKAGSKFWLMIDGREYEIAHHTCVRGRSAPWMNHFLIGNAFFHTWLVQFDMTPPQPTIGFAKINPAYTPVTKLTTGSYTLEQTPVHKLPVTSRQQTLSELPMMHQGALSHASTEVDRLPTANDGGVRYLLDLKMGTPPQKFTVILDTGSSVFGVFVKPKQKEQGQAVELEQSASVQEPSHIASLPLALVVLVMYVGVLGVVLVRRRRRPERSLASQASTH